MESTVSRSGGFDIIRIGAALGVVCLHATTPYLRHPMPGLVWPVSDTPSRIADWVGWSIEIVIMPLFLMIAGYFAVPSCRRFGPWRFTKTRLTRLLLPLLVAGPFILTSDFYVWLTGWVVEGHVGIEKLRSLKFSDGVDTGLWGLSHLWFLPYLFLYSLVMAAVFYWAPARFRRHALGNGEGLRDRFTVGALALCGLAAVAVLWVRPNVVFGFQHAFLPVPSKWLYSGAYFAGGALLASSPSLLERLKRYVYPILALGTMATPVAVLCGWQWLETLTLAPVPARTIAAIPALGLRIQLIVAVVTVFAAWAFSIGAIGWAAQSRCRCGANLEKLAAAAFWIYLFHHPVVGLAHIQLKVLFPGLSSELKLVLSFLIGVTFAFLLYFCLGRKGKIARLMGTAVSTDYISTSTPPRDKGDASSELGVTARSVAA